MVYFIVYDSKSLGTYYLTYFLAVGLAGLVLLIAFFSVVRLTLYSYNSFLLPGV
jgi:hypothetical protein